MMILTDELLLHYKRCRRRTYLDIHGDLQQRDNDKEFLLKLRQESRNHINNVLLARSFSYQKLSVSRRNWSLNAKKTRAMMEKGVDCIYGGVLTLQLADWHKAIEQFSFTLEEPLGDYFSPTLATNLTFLASPTLLIKIAGQSQFGDWSYLPVNIKLGRRPKSEYKLVAAFHAQMLAAIQGSIPAKSQLILRQQDNYFVNLEYWLPKMQATVADCLVMLTELNEPEVFISRQRCSLCHWYNHCYSVAKSEKHLSLVPGVTPKRYEYLNTQGINTVESLAQINPALGNEIVSKDTIEQLRQQAHSILNDRAIFKSSYKSIQQLDIPTSKIELYFDIEAEPELNLDYLLGIVLVDRQNKQQVFHPFLAEKPEEEGLIWQQFLNLVNLYKDAPIFHFSEYEVDTIKRLAKLYGTPKAEVQALLTRFVDLHQLITQFFVLPVESYSLKSLANWLGFQWREEGASGDRCVCWYDRWLKTGDRNSLNSILCYNEDDCIATRYLKDWLVNFVRQSSSSQ
ncbi:MAG: TM0106 family RecB-like putative nuclease [Xenococcaceae cyanobacterium]